MHADVAVSSTPLATIVLHVLVLSRWRALPARICREAGGRVRTNAFVRDLDVPDANPGDGRRLEVVVDGLPLFGGGQFHVGARCTVTADHK